MKYLIVGLGNIGPEYHETRHNIGFMAVDALAKAAGATFTDGRYGFTTTLSVKGRQLLLLKPSTFMNLSGNAVRYWMQKENIPLENVLVVVDDLALPFGTLRLKGKEAMRDITALSILQQHWALRIMHACVSASAMIFPVVDRLTMCWDILPMKIGKQWARDWRQPEKSSKVSAWQE